MRQGMALRVGPLARLRPRALAGQVLPPALAGALALGLWEAGVRLRGVPVYLLPAPSVVLARLGEEPLLFLKEGVVTLMEALGGFLLGTAVALTGAVAMAHSRTLERALFPLAVLVKVTPLIAVAPLFVLWFGFGSTSKVLIASLLTFFPVLVNAIVGFRSVDPLALDFLRSLDASAWEVFRHLRLPSALPYLMAGFRTTLPLAVIGAVVAEWFSGDAGLGAVIIVAYHNLDMPTLFAAVLVLALMGSALTGMVSWLQRRLTSWHESEETTP